MRKLPPQLLLSTSVSAADSICKVASIGSCLSRSQENGSVSPAEPTDMRGAISLYPVNRTGSEKLRELLAFPLASLLDGHGFATRVIRPRHGKAPQPRSDALIKPGDEWVQVPHHASGSTYWWNQRTGTFTTQQRCFSARHRTRWRLISRLRGCTDETTAVGEPKPGPEGRRPVIHQPVPSRGSGLLGLVAGGAGMGLIFSLMSRIF